LGGFDKLGEGRLVKGFALLPGAEGGNAGGKVLLELHQFPEEIGRVG
jgi:hypothetical protein